jgi:hypothetical protein
MTSHIEDHVEPSLQEVKTSSSSFYQATPSTEKESTTEPLIKKPAEKPIQKFFHSRVHSPLVKNTLLKQFQGNEGERRKSEIFRNSDIIKLTLN